MKHIKLLFSVLSFSIFSSIFTMERLPLSKKQLSINCDDIPILDRIDQEINKKYPSTNALVDFFKQFTEKDMLSIIKIPHQWCNENDSDVTPSSLNALYKKNSFFEKAVNYFTEYARENFDNVTTDTIAFVADPDINQSVKQLNLLPLPIKTYIMSRVYDEIESRYPIDITLLTTATLCKICPPINMVATYSKDKILSLWDLRTGLRSADFAREDDLSINMIQFSSNGLRMGTVAHCINLKDNRPKSRIIIWNTYTQQQLHCITQDDSVYHIDFMQGTKDNNLLSAYSQEQHSRHKMLTLWLLNQQQPEKLGQSSPLPWSGETLIDVNLDDTYQGTIDSDDDRKICITKKTPPALHLCQKAVGNHVHEKTINGIKQSQTYNLLTDYEKQIVNRQITSKTTRSALIIPLLLAPRK